MRFVSVESHWTRTVFYDPISLSLMAGDYPLINISLSREELGDAIFVDVDS